jgi:stress responsive alpha/beta barrel protein
MKKMIGALSLLVMIFLFQQNAGAQTSNSSLLRHIVIITFKDDARVDSIKALDNLYSTLSKNAVVKDFEMGVNVSPRDSGIVKHVYVTSFASKDDMDSYRKLPEYQNLFKTSLPISSDVTVVDYWANK